MILIFFFSHMPGDKSSEQSQVVVNLLNFLSVEAQQEDIKDITFLVRKGAHMTEYFILTLSSFKYFKTIGIKQLYITSGVLSFLYACSDEFHQRFIPGRAGAFSDVLVDSCGIIIALILLKALNKK